MKKIKEKDPNISDCNHKIMKEINKLVPVEVKDRTKLRKIPISQLVDKIFTKLEKKKSKKSKKSKKKKSKKGIERGKGGEKYEKRKESKRKGKQVYNQKHIRVTEEKRKNQEKNKSKDKKTKK
jgi:hypothetical protein